MPIPPVLHRGWNTPAPLAAGRPRRPRAIRPGDRDSASERRARAARAPSSSSPAPRRRCCREARSRTAPPEYSSADRRPSPTIAQLKTGGLPPRSTPVTDHHSRITEFMHPLLNIAVKAARRAGNIINRATRNLDVVAFKEKAANDFVSEVDSEAERAIVSTLREAYPGHAILAEESGAS